MCSRFCLIVLPLIILFFGCARPDPDLAQPGSDFVEKTWMTNYVGMDQETVVNLLGYPQGIMAEETPCQEIWYYRPKNKIYYDGNRNFVGCRYIFIFESNKVVRAHISLTDSWYK